MSTLNTLSTIEAQFSPDLLQAVGLLTITAAASEMALSLEVARLLEHPRTMDPRVPFALAGAKLGVLLQQIQSLARLKLQPDQAAAVVALCGKIRDAFDRRNDLAHMLLGPGPTADKGVLRTIRIKTDGSVAPVKPLTVQQIRGFASGISDRVRELDDLLTGYGLPKWSDVEAALQSLAP